MAEAPNRETGQAKPRKIKYRKAKASWNPAMQAIPVSGIRRLVNMASSMKDVIHLSIGQPDLPTPKHIIDAYVDALNAGHIPNTMPTITISRTVIAGMPRSIAAPRRVVSLLGLCTMIWGRCR